MNCTCGNVPHTFGCVAEDDPNSHCVADDYPRDNRYPCSHGDPCLCWDHDPDPTAEEIEAMFRADGYVKREGCGHWAMPGDLVNPCGTCDRIAQDAARREADRLDKEARAERKRLGLNKPPFDSDGFLDPFAD